MREFKNMKIKKVANASEHAMGRTGRILAHVNMDQNGQVVMEYLQTDNNRYCFRLDVLIMISKKLDGPLTGIVPCRCFVRSMAMM